MRPRRRFDDQRPYVVYSSGQVLPRIEELNGKRRRIARSSTKNQAGEDAVALAARATMNKP